MGRDKASLLWEGTPLLLRVLQRLAPIASGAWVAARPGQELPSGDYRRVDDRRPGEGPLAGLAVGLATIGGGEIPIAVAACDYPHADPALFLALRAAAPDARVVFPVFEGRGHPLMALWRSDVAPACERALARGARRVRAVLDEVGAVEVGAGELGGLDLERALLNVNEPPSR
jgi:molybdopterin-guanine dinucleotide biosynthesis protein A